MNPIEKIRALLPKARPRPWAVKKKKPVEMQNTEAGFVTNLVIQPTTIANGNRESNAALLMVLGTNADAFVALFDAAAELFPFANGDRPGHVDGLRHHGCKHQDEECNVNNALDALKAALDDLRTEGP